MNRLSTQERTRVLAALVGGNSVRATWRMTGAAHTTILRFLADAGRACSAYENKHLRGLTCRRIQCDEVWAFRYADEKNVPAEHRGQWGFGDVWTWVALDADSKLVACWHVGRRDPGTARQFIDTLAGRLAHPIQLTTDGLQGYLTAVDGASGADVDYAMLVKLYGTEPANETRYRPARRIGAQQANAFSKKVENLKHALALHVMHYNYCRVHQTHRMTPAMATRLADHPWTLGEIVGLLPR